MKNRMSVCVILAAVMVLVPLMMPAAGMAADVEIHGYGNQDYVKSNKINFMEAKDGTWDFNTMSLVFTAKATDETTIWAKIFAASERTTMEWLYVDHRLGESVDIRVGQMKLPLGIINLIRDMKFLHLAELEPFMYSNKIDFIFENYRGVGLEYNHPWFAIELISGQPEQEEKESASFHPEVTTASVFTTEEIAIKTRDLIGGRLRLKTPIDGLYLMFSAASFREKREEIITTHDLAAGTTTEEETMQELREKLVIASLELKRDKFAFNAEWADKQGGDEEMKSYYIEAGYTFFDKLTPYVRYDHILTDKDSKDDPMFYQKDTTIGLSYKVNDYFKVKAEHHAIKGFAMPVASGAMHTAAEEESWSMFVAGVNFMF